MDKESLINQLADIRAIANNGLTCVKINGKVIKSKDLGSLDHEDELKEISEIAGELLLELEA
nr:MAG TPA: hypothetical protein [Caudoviricetes sp.]